MAPSFFPRPVTFRFYAPHLIPKTLKRSSGTAWSLGACLLVSWAAGCSEKSPSDPPPEPPPPEPVCNTAGAARAEARLLTRSEYRRTVQDLLLTQTDPTASFPPEPLVNGFSNNAHSHQVNPLLIEKYLKSAQALAEEARIAGLARLYSCAPALAQNECAEAFVDQVGTRAYRRPLTGPERDSLLQLYARAAPSYGHDHALSAVLEAMLQAPQFLYRIEAPASAIAGPVVPLGPYEIASRLSYFLHGTMPDADLLAAAANNELRTPEEVEAQARRMLADPKAVTRVREFFESWLALDQLGSVARNGAPEGFASSLKESMLRFTESVFWDGTATSFELYSSPQVFVDDALAPLYGLPAPGPGNWVAHDMPEQRKGILTQPALMAQLAHADQSSPIQRGVFVRDKLFCSPVEPPPPSVDNNPPDPQPDLTTRELFEVHTKAPACARCHLLIDPLGFGFEAYDQLGRFREFENGNPVDASGELVGLDDETLNLPFDGAHQLADIVAPSQTVLECLSHKWFTFAMGRSHETNDNCSLEAALSQAVETGGNLKELMIGITTSDSFRFRAVHDADGPGGTP